jgi:uncharacterized membrane protein
MTSKAKGKVGLLTCMIGVNLTLTLLVLGKLFFKYHKLSSTTRSARTLSLAPLVSRSRRA